MTSRASGPIEDASQKADVTIMANNTYDPQQQRQIINFCLQKKERMKKKKREERKTKNE